MPDTRIINKTMDREDLASPEAQAVVEELNRLVARVRSRGCRISTWYGSFDLADDWLEPLNRGYGYVPLRGAVDDASFPWFLYWEIVAIVINNTFTPGQRLLDLGGSSSLFSYYMASRGFEVYTVDIQTYLVDNGNRTAEKMGWRLKNFFMDMRDLRFDNRFDHITSISVFEHVPMYDRIEINRSIRRFLKKDGCFSITFDFRNPSRRARINSARDVHEQFVVPSGLQMRGNSSFHDNGTNYLLNPFYHRKRPLRYKCACIRNRHFMPWEFFRIKHENDYTFGSLFLKK